MKKKFRYQSILMYSSLQFCGHIEEYFSLHTKKLIVFIVMPRLKNKFNLLRSYRNGKLIKEQRVRSSSNPILYYFYWYIHQVQFIFTYFSYRERFILLSGHPITFFGLTIIKFFRQITTVYWIGDYFPPVSIPLWLFERVKKFYNDRAHIRYYLSDLINLKLNGMYKEDATHHTLMWGVRPIYTEDRTANGKLNLLFIGLIKKGQGLERLFLFLQSHKQFFLTIIGICDDVLYHEYLSLIKKYQITRQVFFPNKFYSDLDLQKVASQSHVGIALYDISPLSSAFYTDPGKIKTYTELGLPVVMTNTTEIAKYIKQFNAGELVSEQSSDVETALVNIHTHYAKYQKGVREFNQYFYFEQYYKKAFVPLEHI